MVTSFIRFFCGNKFLKYWYKETYSGFKVDGNNSILSLETYDNGNLAKVITSPIIFFHRLGRVYPHIYKDHKNLHQHKKYTTNVLVYVKTMPSILVP